MNAQAHMFKRYMVGLGSMVFALSVFAMAPVAHAQFDGTDYTGGFGDGGGCCSYDYTPSYTDYTYPSTPSYTDYTYPSTPSYTDYTYPSTPSYTDYTYPNYSYSTPGYSYPSYSYPSYGGSSYSYPSYSYPSYSSPSYSYPSYSYPSYTSPSSATAVSNPYTTSSSNPYTTSNSTSNSNSGVTNSGNSTSNSSSNLSNSGNSSNTNTSSSVSNPYQWSSNTATGGSSYSNSSATGGSVGNVSATGGSTGPISNSNNNTVTVNVPPAQVLQPQNTSYTSSINSSYSYVTNYPSLQPTYTTPYTYAPTPVYHNPNVPYVTLSQVPYTGLDLGPFGLVMYWSFLVLACLAMAYLIAVKRVHRTIASHLSAFIFGTEEDEEESDETAPVALATAPVRSSKADVIDDFILTQVHRA